MNTVRNLLAAIAALLLAACAADDGYDATGVFEATEVLVAAQGTGPLVAFDVEEGQPVEAEECVGCIDTTQLHLKRQQLLAQLQANDSRRRDVERQVAALRQQIATQEKERRRFERLVGDEAANRKQLDDIVAQIALLEKQLTAQTEVLRQTNRGAAAEGEATRALIAQTSDQIRKCTVRSPLRGRVLEKYAEPGEFVATGSPLFKVADLTALHLRAYVTADQLTRLRLGQRVRVFADWGTDERREYAGTVTWMADQAEFTPKTIQTRDERANLVYAIKVAVRNDGYIKNGMHGEVSFGTDDGD